jgi:L-lactate dehydrogenase (cytochrome)
MFYDYVDSGSWTESTYRANERDLAAICFRQRVAVNIENRSIRSTMIGEDVAMPVALAPTPHARGRRTNVVRFTLNAFADYQLAIP